MTSIICWKVNEDNQDSLWITSDSRISNPTSSGEKILNEMCPKILSIPLKVCSNSLSQRPYEYSSIGFAFAGSTLIAHITKDVFSYILSSFKEIPQGLDNSPVDLFREIKISKQLFSDAEVIEFLKKTPSMSELSILLVDILKSVLNSYGSSVGSINTGIEILIAGFCHHTQRLEAYMISYLPNDDIIKCHHHDFNNDNYLILGDKKESIRDSINTLFSQAANELVTRRAPLYVLAKEIEEGKFLSIGGYLQLAHCHLFGCNVSGFMKNNEFYYIGFNPHSQDGHSLTLKTLGQFIISPTTMSYPEIDDDLCISGTLQQE